MISSSQAVRTAGPARPWYICMPTGIKRRRREMLKPKANSPAHFYSQYVTPLKRLPVSVLPHQKEVVSDAAVALALETNLVQHPGAALQNHPEPPSVNSTAVVQLLPSVSKTATLVGLLRAEAVWLRGVDGRPGCRRTCCCCLSACRRVARWIFFPEGTLVHQGCARQKRVSVYV